MSEPANFIDTAGVLGHLKDNVVTLSRADGRPNRFRRERFSDIEPKPSEWLIKHFLPAEGVAIIAGPSTVGKSFVVLYICIRIALGKDMLGHKTKRSGIIYVAAEGQNGMRKRIKAVREKWSIRTGLFQFIGVAPNLLEEMDALELIESLREGAAEMQAEEGADLGMVVIDTTAASMPGGNENSGEFMSKLLANAGLISRETGALVVLVGHTGKNEELGVRGWSGQIGNSDAILYLTRDKEEPDLRLGLVYKLKDGEDGERFAYRLKKINMGVDPDGDEISSAWPIFEDPPSDNPTGKAKAPELKPGAKLIMRALNLLIDGGSGAPAPALQGVRAGTVAVSREQLRERAQRLGYAEGSQKPDSARRAFNRELQSLAALNRVRVEGEQVWPL